MIENINVMRKRHKVEIQILQDNCAHLNISDWMNYERMSGHVFDKVKVCNYCGKIMKIKPTKKWI